MTARNWAVHRCSFALQARSLPGKDGRTGKSAHRNVRLKYERERW
jgi:hypothetical protein